LLHVERVEIGGKDLTHINLRHFGELRERLANYLGGLEAAMCDLANLKQDFEAEMASYCDDYYAGYDAGY
jgi:hypothetical protein